MKVWRLRIECVKTFRTHKLFLKVAESFPVPNWSTSFKIPWTFAFILKTWSDNDDCRIWNTLSSRDCEFDDDSERDGWARPASISWKLMLLLKGYAFIVRVGWVRLLETNTSGRNVEPSPDLDIMWLKLSHEFFPSDVQNFGKTFTVEPKSSRLCGFLHGIWAPQYLHMPRFLFSY